MLNIKYLINCGLISCLMLLSCIKPGGHYGENSLSTAGAEESCEIDGQHARKLPIECVERIITRLPFREVLRIFPPSSPRLQALVKERIGNHWPRWFLNEIEKTGNPRPAGERLVLAYMAFLRLPNILGNRTLAAKILDVQGIRPTATHAFDKIVGSLEDRTIAIVDTTQRTLTLYSLEKARVLSTAPIPAREYATMGGAEAQIVPLSENRFISALRYHAEDRTPWLDRVVWTWDRSGSLTRERILPPARVTFPRSLAPDRERFQKTILRSSSQSFLTLDLAWDGHLSRGFQVHLESAEDGTVLKTAFIPRESLAHYEGIRVEFGTYRRPDGERFALTQKRQRLFLELFEKVRKAGFDLDTSHAERSSLLAVGGAVDQKTRMVIFDASVMFFSHDYLGHTMLYRTSDGPISGKSLLARFWNKDGDIVFSNGDQYVVANLWKSVMRVVSDPSVLESCYGGIQ